MRDVALIAGIAWNGAKLLPVPELVGRLATIQEAAQRYFAQLPEEALCRMLPNRPRSYAELGYHIFNIADALLEHEVQGLPLKEGAYGRVPQPGMQHKAALLDYGRDVAARLSAWWNGPGRIADFARQANVYYGDVMLHEYLERTTWRAGQHVRQLMMVLGMLGISPDRPLGPETFAGLPLPERVWDDERARA